MSTVIAVTSPSPAADSVSMSRGRLWLIHGVLAVTVGLSLGHALIGEENWPFCAYKMFADTRTERTVVVLRMFGVVDGPEAREIPMLNGPYIPPFDQARLSRALWRLQQKRDGQARTVRALEDCLQRYDARRAAGEHDGPPLSGMRLYELTWTLDPQARNADHPDRRRLLAEVRE